MIAKSKLKAGAYYYFVTYEDRDLTVPVIETLRFKKEVSENGAEEKLYLFDRLGGSEPKQCRLTEDLSHCDFGHQDSRSSRNQTCKPQCSHPKTRSN